MSLISVMLGKPLATSEERAEHIGPVARIPVFGLDAVTTARESADPRDQHSLVPGTVIQVETLLAGEARLDHVGVAVRSIAVARGFYELLGLTIGAIEEVEREQVRVAMITIGETRLELLEATAEDSSIGRFVARRGEGLHHVAIRRLDVDAVFARLTREGVRLASGAVGAGAGGHRYFFVHPAAAGGVLIEVVGP